MPLGAPHRRHPGQKGGSACRKMCEIQLVWQSASERLRNANNGNLIWHIFIFYNKYNNQLIMGTAFEFIVPILYSFPFILTPLWRLCSDCSTPFEYAERHFHCRLLLELLALTTLLALLTLSPIAACPCSDCQATVAHTPCCQYCCCYPLVVDYCV